MGERGFMRVFAIGDLHLSGAMDKSMDIFGQHWENHWEKIRADWAAKVQDEDVVLIPGDISWAMALDDAKVDLDSIGQMPGRIVLLRGNHDYWWSSLSRVRSILPPRMYALQNDCITLGDLKIAGSRGWLCPNERVFTKDDEKIYQRELLRLELSLKAVKAEQPPLVMLHYPPFNDRLEPSGFTDLLERYGVRRVLYGHLHGPGIRNGFTGCMRGVEYQLVSCDALDFKLAQIESW